MRRSLHRIPLFFILPLLLAFPLRASAQEAGPLVVGVYHAPPFAIEGGDGWDGISVHLWRDAAEELDLRYEWRPIEPEAAVRRLADGTVDVVVGAVASAEAERRVDFTHSHYVSSIGFAEPARRSLRAIVQAFFSPRFWTIALWLSVAWLVVGVVAWLFERSANEDQFGGGPGRGVWAGFWWAAVTMSTIGYGDKAPRSVGGRIVALVWMLVAMAITAVLTATLTSVLVRDGTGSVDFPGDLSRMAVGSVEGSAAAAFLRGERIGFRAFDGPQAGLEAVRGDSIDVFVHDGAVLRFIERSSPDLSLRVRETDYSPQHRAFALPEGSVLREPLDAVVLDRIEEPSWRRMVERYVSRRSK